MGNACYHSVGNLLSCLRSGTVKKCLKTIFPVVLYGRETWSLQLRDKQRLNVYEKRALTKIFGPIRDEVV
jgi:hypothetical protein